jgi:translation initiation factor 4E
MGSTIKNIFSSEEQKQEISQDSTEKIKKNPKEYPNEIKINIPEEIPKEIVEYKKKEKKEILYENKCENKMNTYEKVKDDKNSTEPSISCGSDEKKIVVDGVEEKENKSKRKDSINIVDELNFPIIYSSKKEEEKNSEIDSLSLLNKALSQSPSNFYNMNLSILENFGQNNNISSSVTISNFNSDVNPIKFSIPNFYLNTNPKSYNYFSRKYHKNPNLTHLVPVSFSCSLANLHSNRARSRYIQKEKEFFEKIIKIGDVSNINEFWEIFQHMKKPSQCQIGSDYHLFKRGIVPMWEDNMNKDGGKLSILLTWKYVDIIWEEMTFNFCKGLLPYYDNMNGIVISTRPKYIVMSFWVKSRNYHTVEKMRNALSYILQTPSNNCIDFIPFN